MTNKLNILGFARKAGKLACGANAVIRSILSAKSFLVIIATDAGESIAKKTARLCNENDIPYITYGTSLELSEVLGKENKVVFSIEDENLAKGILEKIKA